MHATGWRSGTAGKAPACQHQPLTHHPVLLLRCDQLPADGLGEQCRAPHCPGPCIYVADPKSQFLPADERSLLPTPQPVNCLCNKYSSRSNKTACQGPSKHGPFPPSRDSLATVQSSGTPPCVVAGAGSVPPESMGPPSAPLQPLALPETSLAVCVGGGRARCPPHNTAPDTTPSSCKHLSLSSICLPGSTRTLTPLEFYAWELALHRTSRQNGTTIQTPHRPCSSPEGHPKSSPGCGRKPTSRSGALASQGPQSKN